MRSFIGPLLVGLGVFALAAALFVRFLVAPQMVAAPKDVYQVTRLQATNATYFHVPTTQQRKGVTLTVTNTLRGDPKAATGDTVVWDNTTVVEDLALNYKVDIREQRLAFDRRTAQLTRCCGAHVAQDASAPMSGIGVFWPVEMERRDYQYFDASTKRAWPAKYSGTETVNGVSAYKFVVTIPPTVVAATNTALPANLLGLPGNTPVPVDRFTQTTATFWIDPRSGVPIDQRQQVRSVLRPKAGGPGELVVADMDLVLTPQSKAALKDRVEDSATGVLLLKTVLPLACLVLGLVLLGIGLAIGVGAGGARHRRQTQQPAAAAS